jgi:tetratricopeptide (TPR) repeat protein
MRRDVSSLPRSVFLGVVLAMGVMISAGVPAGGQAESGGSRAAAGADVDHIGIAAVMIRDGNFDRAERALEQVDTTGEDVDLPRYYTLRGLVNVRTGDFAGAIDSFLEARAAGQDDPVLNEYLAQAYYGDRRYDEAIDAIDAVPSLVQYPALYGILAESYWQLGDHGEAYDTLSRAIELFPGETQFLRQQIFYLIDLDLTREAIERSLVYLERLDDDPDAYVTVGEALRRGGEARLAVETLEMGALRNPSDQRIRLALAQAYLDVGMVRTAGAIVERAAAYDPALYVEAAEIFRRAGDYPRALYLNSLVLDEARKALQRFHLLLATERYESAVALETRLLRTANLEDDANRYAMAFALYQTRQFGRAIGYLNQIDGSDFFRRATQLRQAIETVREADLSGTEGESS